MGKYKNIGAQLNRDFRNNLNANFNDIDTDIQAQRKRVDDLIVGNPQPSEVVDARGEFSVLRDRFEDVDAQLEDITTLSSQYATLQLAFDNVLPSKTITVPSGEYQLNGALSFKGGKKYIGYGVTLKTMVETAYISANESDIIIEGFTFDGNNVVMNGFALTNSKNVEFVNCTFKNTTKYGLTIIQGTNVRIKNCEFLNSGRQDFMSSGCAINGADILLENCRANGNLLGNGFVVYGDTNKPTTRISFVSCTANGNLNHGFLTNSLNGYTNKPVDIKFVNCRANQNGRTNNTFSGFALHYVDQAILKNCTASENKEHGIVLMDGALFEISGCSIKDNFYSGVRLQADWIRPEDNASGVKNSIISNNIIADNGNYVTVQTGYEHLHNGILVEGNCHYIDINNNQIINNDGRSIFVKTIGGYSDCTNIYANDNTIMGNTLSNDIIKTVTTPTIIGVNRIAGVIKSIRAEESDELYKNIDLNTIVASGGTIDNLKITPNALYRALTGETFTINSLDATSYPAGTKFFVIFQSNSSTGGITINAGTNIDLPDNASPFIINKANSRQAKIYEFVKISGSKFCLKG